MYMGQYLDLICQVVSVATLPVEKCTVARVWDGTHYKGSVIKLCVFLYDTKTRLRGPVNFCHFCRPPAARGSYYPSEKKKIISDDLRKFCGMKTTVETLHCGVHAHQTGKFWG